MTDEIESPAPEIRYLGDMQRLQPQPGDVYVLFHERLLSIGQSTRLRDYFQAVVPGSKVIVLDGGMKLGLIGTLQEPPEPPKS